MQLSSILVSSGKIHDTHTVGQLIPKINTVILVSKPQKKTTEIVGQEALLHKNKTNKTFFQNIWEQDLKVGH